LTRCIWLNRIINRWSRHRRLRTIARESRLT